MSAVTYRMEDNREVLLYGDGTGGCHVLTEAACDPARLNYVQRRVLSARLRALADLIDDPRGEWQ